MFDRLALQPDSQWPTRVLRLAASPERFDAIRGMDLAYRTGYWGDAERGLNPPVSLLSWLIRNLRPPTVQTEMGEQRQRLLRRDCVTIEDALTALRSSPTPRGWHIFEGQTFPDAFIETPDALIVVEGKRTEPGPTTVTKWMAGRHQIWRHIDAAWEMKGSRAVFGLFIVEGDGADCPAVPAVWQSAVDQARSVSVLGSSFPHRGAEERAAIANCLIGGTTWQAVCKEFGIDFGSLPNSTADL